MTSFISCPRCHNRYWRDIPDPDNPHKAKFACGRCSYAFKPGVCSSCGRKAWNTAKGIRESTAHRPYYRLTCGGCGKTVGILIDSP